MKKELLEIRNMALAIIEKINQLDIVEIVDVQPEIMKPDSIIWLDQNFFSTWINASTDRYTSLYNESHEKLLDKTKTYGVKINEIEYILKDIEMTNNTLYNIKLISARIIRK